MDEKAGMAFTLYSYSTGPLWLNSTDDTSLTWTDVLTLVEALELQTRFISRYSHFIYILVHLARGVSPTLDT